jgi:hypothetical protein
VRADCHDNLRNPKSVNCSRIVLYSDSGHPIFIAIAVGEDIVMSAVGDPDFESTLRNFGITSTLIVDTISVNHDQNIKLLS